MGILLYFSRIRLHKTNVSVTIRFSNKVALVVATVRQSHNSNHRSYFTISIFIRMNSLTHLTKTFFLNSD